MGWQWSVEPQTYFDSAAEVEKRDPEHEIQATLRDALVQAGVVRAASSSWFDSEKASSFATVYATPAGARSALAAERTFAQAWFPEYEHVAIRMMEAAGLGEESWAVGAGSVAYGFIEIGWTRGNAVLGVYVNCTPCAPDSDLFQAARWWADAIDEEARAAAE